MHNSTRLFFRLTASESFSQDELLLPTRSIHPGREFALAAESLYWIRDNPSYTHMPAISRISNPDDALNIRIGHCVLSIR